MKINTIPLDVECIKCNSIEEFIEEGYKAFCKHVARPIKFDRPKKLQLGILFLSSDLSAGSLVSASIVEIKKSASYHENKDLFLKIIKCDEDTYQYFLNKLIREEDSKTDDLSG